jgi:hypothetical protein
MNESNFDIQNYSFVFPIFLKMIEKFEGQYT